jgi:SET domain-containing protein
MGRSAIEGWGLFAGDKIKPGQFLGVAHLNNNRMLTEQEYKGEIIGNEESERRGLLYDKKGVSFLFTLNRGLQFVRWELILMKTKLSMQLELPTNFGL